ncbi:hypothetical protein [Aequorivita sp. CIP111184]|uniref:hypothetical protein n=1 Tax=Aequorivita sp. CIP111184 TaxID=2211356 RepID=UPI000DBC3B18|nr:hypothetical protein [Aequorivita sp. CIP111184]SRX52337.1 hypothetical protein AEQU1_00201 [Aequorivita sp. CIP111184]
MGSKIIIAFLTFVLVSCGTIGNRSQNVETNSPAEIEAKKIAAKEKMDAGYLPGRIIYSEEADDCEYTIQLKEGERDFYYVDPINLDENFHTDGQTIWVKYAGLNRMNRCEKAAPVSIIEIENRDE